MNMADVSNVEKGRDALGKRCIKEPVKARGWINKRTYGASAKDGLVSLTKHIYYFS